MSLMVWYSRVLLSRWPSSTRGQSLRRVISCHHVYEHLLFYILTLSVSVECQSGHRSLHSEPTRH
jgi:hypothetical protein